MVQTRSGARVTRQRERTPRRRAPTCEEAGAKLRTCPRPGVRARRRNPDGGTLQGTTPSGSQTPPGVFGVGARPHIGKKITKVKKSMEVGGSGPGAGGNQTPPPPMGGAADHDMVNLPLFNLSANQKQRLRNGKGVRVTMGSGCDKCTSCIMSQENAKKIVKKKGGAATIVLGKGEIDQNNFSGSGIMPSKRGGPIHGAYKAPPSGGMIMGPDADGCYTSYTQNIKEGRMDKKKTCPPKPTGKKPKGGWKGLGPSHSSIIAKTAGKGSNAVRDPARKVGGSVKIGNSRFDKPSGSNFRRNTGGWGIGDKQSTDALKAVFSKLSAGDKREVGSFDNFRKMIAAEAKRAGMGDPDVDRMSTDNIRDLIDDAKDEGHIADIDEDALVDAFLVAQRRMESVVGENTLKKAAKKAQGKGLWARGNGMYASGGAIGSHMSANQMTNVGAGGNLLSPMAASKAPQAAAQNFFFASQFPPSLAHDIRGAGHVGSFFPWQK